MAKNKVIDPGLAYLREIGFDRIRSVSGIYDRFNKLYGIEKTTQIFEQRRNISDGSLDFYAFKNSDPEISKAFTELYDGDIIRKACNYIASHKEYFGKTILEVGCESGYMTGFLAKAFPDARIVAIDRCEAAVDLAARRMEQLGITNVEFKVNSLEDITEQFDTVFCMRTLQENWNNDRMPYVGEPLASQFYQYAELTKNYSDLLKAHVKDNGALCVFERIGHDPLLCGWMISLCSIDCPPDTDTYKEVVCEEVTEKSVFQAFICHKGVAEDQQKMIDLWYDGITIKPARNVMLHDWEALSYLSINAGRLVRGVRIFDEDEQVGRFAAFEDKNGAPVVYYLNAACDEITLFSFELSDKENSLKQIQEAIDLNVNAGLHYEEIDPQEGFLEGNKLVFR